MGTMEEYAADEKRDAALQAAYNDGDAHECVVCHGLFFDSDLTEGPDGELRCADHDEYDAGELNRVHE